MKRYAAPELIADFMCEDLAEVKRAAYQTSRYRAPRVYARAGNPWLYLCCPAENQKPPKGFTWEIAGYSFRDQQKTRPIYGAKNNPGND
jgi:hypothetical protein